jgi:hypothetical protein
MANFSDLGRLLLIAGGAIVLLGLVLLLVGRVPLYIVSEAESTSARVPCGR